MPTYNTLYGHRDRMANENDDTTVYIMLEVRPGRKPLTHVIGLDERVMKGHLKELRRVLKVNGTIIPRKTDRDKTLMILGGDHRLPVHHYLLGESVEQRVIRV